MDLQQISNSGIFWALCGITVIIALVQAYLFFRYAQKTEKKAGIPSTITHKAMRIGLISAIGPAMGVFIVMVGLISSLGGPMSWLRLSIIGAAPTELTAATLASEAAGATLGGEGYTITVMAVAWFAMALNGAGWLVMTGVFTPQLETLREKVSGGDTSWLIEFSGAASLGIFGYLCSNEMIKSFIGENTNLGSAAAVVAGALFMVLMVKVIVPKVPKLMEYSLGISMLVGMAAAIILEAV
ncbi:MAG: DUF5058 family protein [Sporomusa sp.]